MSHAYLYESTLRAHDEAIGNWLNTLLVDYDTSIAKSQKRVPILWTFATPDRAFAAVLDLLKATNWIDDAKYQSMSSGKTRPMEVLPLPVATIERGEPQPDTELAGSAKQLRCREYDPATGVWTTHPWPLFFRTDYTITFWCAKGYTDDFLREWVASKMGAQGFAQNEFGIAVKHRAPWGTMVQSVKFMGSSNLTDLEGANPRYLRFQAVFSLRTLFMRQALDSAPTIDEVKVCAGDPSGDGASLSGNLFSFYLPPDKVPALWPKTGEESTVGLYYTSTNKPVLRVGGEDPADSVNFADTQFNMMGQDTAVLSYSFRYARAITGSGPFVVSVGQHDPGGDTETLMYAETREPDAMIRRFHRFVPVTKAAASFDVSANGGEMAVLFADISVRAVRGGTRLAPDVTDLGGGATRYSWAGLAAKSPHLVVLVISGGSGNITVYSDSPAGSFSEQRSVGGSAGLGTVFLIQPDASTLSLVAPSGVTVDKVFAQRYDGPIDGNDV